MYCFRCDNWRQRPNESAEGCPIWDMHLLYSYELCNEKDHPGKVMLDALIPMDDDHFAAECRFFTVKQEPLFVAGEEEE